MTRRRSRHVEAILADQRLPAHPIADADDVDALATAIELRAARLGAGQPSESFVTDLRRRLAEENEPPVPRRALTRRTALAGMAGAVAGAAAVAAGFELVSGSPTAPDGSVGAGGPLDPVGGRWTVVGTVTELAAEPIRPFATDAVSGFLSIQSDGSPVAVNGVCTHQGCRLRPDATGRRLDCPCHRTAFAPDGTLLFHELPTAPAPLTRLRVRRSGDAIEAWLPA